MYAVKHDIQPVCIINPSCNIYTQTARPIITGYNQSDTCCGSQRRHVVVTQ